MDVQRRSPDADSREVIRRLGHAALIVCLVAYIEAGIALLVAPRDSGANMGFMIAFTAGTFAGCVIACSRYTESETWHHTLIVAGRSALAISIFLMAFVAAGIVELLLE